MNNIREAFEQNAAVREYEARYPRKEAEKPALEDIKRKFGLDEKQAQEIGMYE